MIILGIDPGTATTGFAVIKVRREIKGRNIKSISKEVKVIDYGCIKTTPDLCSGDRLKKISNELTKIIGKHDPEILAVESLFFFKNLKTVMPVSQAKGVILMTAAKKKIPVYEFTPLQVKMIVSGYGRTEKKQVQEKIKNLLNLEKKPKDVNKRQDDATDALGIALCYIFQLKNKLKISQA